MRKKKQVDFDLTTEPLQKLPHSLQLEKCVLGLLMDLPDDLMPLAIKYLKADGMFYNELTAKLWAVLTQLSADGRKASYEEATRQFELLRDGEMTVFTNSLKISGDNPIYFTKHCLKLNEFWIQRVLHKYGYYINQSSLMSGIDALELLGEASDTLGSIFLHIAKMKESTMSDAISGLALDIVEIAKAENGIIGLHSSLYGLNRVIKGYRKGNFIVVGASTGEGKTTFAIQEARNLIEMGIPVGYISSEMSQRELLLIMACDACGIDTRKIFDNTVSADEMNRLDRYLGKIKKLPLYIIDKPGMRISEIKAVARNWQKNNGIQMLFIDHLHLVYDDSDQSNPEQRFTNIANKCKELAKELDIPVMGLAQLHRKDSHSKTQPHQISDLKYASGIEQAADVIILIFRPKLHGIDNFPDGGSTENFARFIIGKLRLLPKENISCRFLGTRFNDWDHVNAPFPTVPDNPAAGITPNYRQFSEPVKIEDDTPF